MADHVTKSGVHHSNGGYTNMFQATVKEGYKLVGTAREGLLNEVAFERVRSTAGVDDAMAVLSGFDMNCVQVGVDAQSGRLVWTPGFEEFLATSELKVVNVNTPFHTAARYFKKKRALGCYGDDEFNMAMCALPWARGVFGEHRRGFSEISSVAGRYGMKTHQDYAQEAESLSQWFKEVKALDKANIWTMEPVFKGREEVLKKLKTSANQSTARGLWRGETATLMFTNAREFCQTHLKPEARAVTGRLARLDALMERVGATRESVDYVMGLAQAKGVEFFGRQDLSENEARALSKLLNGHPAFGDVLSQMTLKKQAEVAVFLRASEQGHGDRLYGWLESRLGSWMDPTGQEKVGDLLHDHKALAEFFALEKAKGERRLAEQKESLASMSSLAVSVAKSLLKVKFEELLTTYALEMEGRDMRHCVGGYGRLIENGTSRIFKVTGSEADRSTMELRLGGGGEGASLGQIRSFANKDPGPAALAAGLMVSKAFDRPRDDQVLHVAPALVQALDQGAVAAGKMGSAKKLLRVAAMEARSRGEKFSKLADSIDEGFKRHFEKEPELVAEKTRRLEKNSF